MNLQPVPHTGGASGFRHGSMAAQRTLAARRARTFTGRSPGQSSSFLATGTTRVMMSTVRPPPSIEATFLRRLPRDRFVTGRGQPHLDWDGDLAPDEFAPRLINADSDGTATRWTGNLMRRVPSLA
jgi:hypothetical protein